MLIACVEGSEEGHVRYAVCFYGMFGSMNKKGRAGSDLLALPVSFQSQKKYLFDPNIQTHTDGISNTTSVDVFSHSWEENHTEARALFHRLYDPYLRRFKHETPMDIVPVHSMFTSMARSVELMSNYSSEQNINYTTVVLMRYDLFFRSPLHLNVLDPSHFWVATWCNNPLKSGILRKEHVNIEMGHRSSSYVWYKKAKYEEGKRTKLPPLKSVRDEIFISSPEKLENFFGLLRNKAAADYEKKNWVGLSHRLIGGVLDNMGWMEDNTVQEIPDFICHIHFAITRRCNVVPLINLDSIHTCDANRNVKFQLYKSIQQRIEHCPGLGEALANLKPGSMQLDENDDSN